MPDGLARVTEAQKSLDRETAHAAKLRADIATAEARAALQVLIAHADALGDKLLETVKAIAVAAQRANAGGRPPWGPGPELRKTLRRISLERREFE